MPSRALYAWTPNTGPQPSSTVLGHSLRRLHSFHGHMFPVERMYRLWAAITAAKAQEGAVPLTHLGTSMARSGFQPFARFLEASGTHLQSLHLDMRVVAFWREDNAVDAFHSSGLSLSGCRQLRKLTVGLHAPSRRWSCSHVSVFAALLCTTARCAPLAHITVIFDILTTEAFEIPGFPEGLAALDGRMAEMPQLRRVDWLLAQSGGGRQQSPDDVNSVEYRSGMLKTYFCAVARREEVEVSWRALRRD
ncbi:hypothetical protein PsYK624_122860 [Phanerochaete sordida]|uniref:Uncharacterized protein n=1 Tax=Phanerochaete sordida TaxID=48140 RepID=A0A9P3GHJ2_9APHY|nr:hypothetical protein PsYK624_122860 [Phanerochaete sordida]